jgi:hypothetical protein
MADRHTSLIHVLDLLTFRRNQDGALIGLCLLEMSVFFLNQ